jgi:hypothetical protein
MLSDEAGRLWHADRQTAMDCIAVIDRIDVLIRPGPASPPGYPVPLGCVLHGGVDLRRDIPQHDLDLLRAGGGSV